MKDIKVMNKNPQYWAKNFNLIGLCQSFNAEFKEKFGVNYYGEINVIIYDRKDLSKVKELLEFDTCLNGYVPTIGNDMGPYDFILCVDKLLPFHILIEQLFPIYRDVFAMNIKIGKSQSGGLESVVYINKSY